MTEECGKAKLTSLELHNSGIGEAMYVILS